MGMPPLPPRRLDDEPHRLHNSGAAAFVGLCVGVLILVVSGWLLLGPPTETAASPTTTRAAAPSTTPPPSTVRTTTPVPPRPIERTGIAITVGKVTANDGTTLVVKNAVTGNSVKVRTDADTKVYVLIAKRAKDIRVGAAIAVYGRQHPDQTINADFITGISFGAAPN
ncbi:hypothetical protein ACW9HR_23480 [Nocardia gipuzkoensis]|uniref:hypothetical protein n=1 Tax=Nocardia gipuzkoensis TaxID=2749991 RepID=UPI0015EEADDE|nr:hypothetical protein [Nocardia gipuzkoensis]